MKIDSARSLVVLLETGDPEGPRVAHMPMSTIRAFAFSRDDFLSARDHFKDKWQRPGVYFLYGDLFEAETSVPTVYIGESELVGTRLNGHFSTGGNRGAETYDYWTDTIVLVSEDDGLSKAHVRHIEAALTAAAQSNGEWEVKTGRNPAEDAGALPRHDKVSASRFIGEAKVLCGILGLNLFKPSKDNPPLAREDVPPTDPTPESPDIRFVADVGSGRAIMTPRGDGTFVAIAQSRAAKEAVSSLSPSYIKLRETLRSNGILLEQNGQLVFDTDYSFQSLAAITQVVSGSTYQGRTFWKLEGSETTYGQWETQQLNLSAADSDIPGGVDIGAN